MIDLRIILQELNYVDRAFEALMSQHIISTKHCAEYMQTQTRGLSIADDQNPSWLFSLTHPPQHIFSKGFLTTDALEEHDEKISIGDSTITNLRFADDINALAGEEQALEALVESLDRICSRYKMEISAEKTKLATNIASGIKRKNKVKGQKLGIVTSFKCSFKWRDSNISFGSKVKLVCHISLCP